MTTSVIIFACEAELFLNMSRGSPVEGRIVKLPGHKNVLTEFQYSWMEGMDWKTSLLESMSTFY